MNGPGGLSEKVSGISTDGYGTQVSGIDLSPNATLEASFVPDINGETEYGTLGIEAGVVKEDYFYTNKNTLEMKGRSIDYYEVCLVEDETLEVFLTLTGTNLFP